MFNLQHLSKEIDKEIARAVVDDDEKLNILVTFKKYEIDIKTEVGEFTQDEVTEVDQEVAREQI
jgi:hypothetical protein